MSRTTIRKATIRIHTDGAVIVGAYIHAGDASYSFWNGMDAMALTGPAGFARSLIPAAMVVRATKR